MAEEIIWDEIQRNNIYIEKDTLYFHMNECLRKHSELYENVRIGVDNLSEKLCDIYREMHVVNFGRIIAYLAFVLRVSDFCDEHTIREAMKRTVEAFRHVDLEKHKPQRRRNWLLLLTMLICCTFSNVAMA